MATFGAKLRGLRAIKNLKQVDVAQMAGIPRHYIVQFEKEVTIPAPKTQAALENALGIKFNDPNVEAAFNTLTAAPPQPAPILQLAEAA